METIRIQAEDEEQLKTVKAILKALKVPFKVSKENPYDPNFVDKIKESERQVQQGKVKAIKSEDLWK